MKPEYDFSKAERGKFFHDKAKSSLPVYLDQEVQSYLQKCAQSKGVDFSQLVNDILRHDINLIEVVK